MRNHLVAKHQKSGDAAGQIVFTLAGLMVLTWLIGTCVYAIIPQSTKNKTVAANSESAESESSQVALLDSDDEGVDDPTESDSQTSSNENENELSSSKPTDETSWEPKPSSEPSSESKPESNTMSGNGFRSAPVEKAREPFDPEPQFAPEPKVTPEPKVAPEPQVTSEPKVAPEPENEMVAEAETEEETNPIPQPKLNLGGGPDDSNSNPTRLDESKVAESPIEKAETEREAKAPTFEPEPMLAETDTPASEPEQIPANPKTPEVGPQPDGNFSGPRFPMRDWISSTGGTARMAFVRRTEDGGVLVINEAGKQFKVPFARFSVVDQQYIDNATESLRQQSFE